MPTPEEVFNIPKLDFRSLMLKVLGPSVIAVGVGIGGGEWLLGPATAVKYGLGVMWVVVLSALLQTVYNISLVRIVIYTGESPVVYLRRVPPDPTFWTIAVPIMIVVWGSWGLAGIAGSAATALGSMVLGRLSTADMHFIRALPGTTTSTCCNSCKHC